MLRVKVEENMSDNGGTVKHSELNLHRKSFAEDC